MFPTVKVWGQVHFAWRIIEAKVHRLIILTTHCFRLRCSHVIIWRQFGVWRNLGVLMTPRWYKRNYSWPFEKNARYKNPNWPRCYAVCTFQVYTVNEKSQNLFAKNVLLVERKLKFVKQHIVTWGVSSNHHVQECTSLHLHPRPQFVFERSLWIFTPVMLQMQRAILYFSSSNVCMLISCTFPFRNSQRLIRRC
jgi:hypothetical protein